MVPRFSYAVRLELSPGAAVFPSRINVTDSSTQATVQNEEVFAHLKRLFLSRHFMRSERLQRFLQFTVEQALAGTGHHLKEQVVGVQVFDRRTDYDPRIDPIVRVEARRLRSKLQDYYAAEGSAEAFTIDFPKGTYAPVFLKHPAGPASIRDATETSIAVLPFTNLTPGTGDEYFSDGLTEELIHFLTRVKELRVVSWDSASRLRGQEQNLEAIREQLKAGILLRGSVRRTPERVRVAAQLIDTASGEYLWSEIYDRPMQDVFSIQEQIAGAIVEKLRLALAIPGRGARARRTNVECYNLCLQGRFHANRRTIEGLEKSVACYEQAIATDPTSALAHAGLADAYSLLADYGIVAASEAIPKARRAAQRSLELDPGSAEAYVALAFIRSLHDWEWDDAESLYRRAIAANPGYARAHHWFGIDFLSLLGRFEEALAEAEIARRLDPLSQINAEGTASVYLMARRYDNACKAFRDVIELDPTFYKPYAGLGRVFSLMERYDESIAMYQKAHMLAGDVPNLISGYGQTLARAGRTREANECLQKLHEIARAKSVHAASFGILHMGLGDRDQALTYFEKACDNREVPAAGFGFHPLYDPLRSEPRFQALLRRMKLLP